MKNGPVIRGGHPGATREAWAALDALPPAARKALALANFRLSAIDLLKVARQRGWTEEQMVKAIHWLDEKTTREFLEADGFHGLEPPKPITASPSPRPASRRRNSSRTLRARGVIGSRRPPRPLSCSA